MTASSIQTVAVVPAALEIEKISKSFAGTQALKEVDLFIEAGEVHGLVGPNGSGKSTLVKILAGYHQADRLRRIAIAGVELPTNFSPKDIRAKGIGFVHQDLGLIDECSIADNFAFSARGFVTSTPGNISWRRHNQFVHEVLERIQLDVDPSTLVNALSPAERTLVAIGRALSQFDCGHLLILDEPTARLPHNEVDILLESLRQIASNGTAILYVTHRLSELFEFSERITVLKDAQVATCVKTAETSPQDITNLMTGSAEEASISRFEPSASISRAYRRQNEEVATLRNVSTDRMRRVDLSLNSGFVSVLTGAVGSGAEDCAAVLYGLKAPLDGEIRLYGQPAGRITIDAARRAGIAYLPPDRQTQAAFFESTVEDNVLIADLRPVTNGIHINRTVARGEAERVVKEMAVSPPDPDYVFRGLSGGNQQKALFGKWLRVQPRILILNEPTYGVDVGSRLELYETIRAVKKQGMAILWITSDLEEAMEIADMIGVFFKGELVLSIGRENATLSDVSRAAMGV